MKNLKALMEKRAELQQKMDDLVNTADNETRAMTEEETAAFDESEKEIRAIDETLAREERARGIESKPLAGSAEERAAEEEKAFADYVMGKVTEMRAGEQNMTMTNNGAIIPTTIADRVIKAVKDRCPILARATIYNVKGTLKVPVWGKANSTHDIAVGYQTEFTEITADSGKFTSVDLGGYLAGALTLIGKSVENNGAFSVVNFIIEKVAPAIRNVINRASDLIFSFFNRIATITTGIIKAFRGVLDFFTGVFSGDWKKAWEGIKTAISGAWDAIWAAVKGNINLIIDGVNLLWTGIYNTVSALVNSIGNVVKTVGDLLGKDWGFSMPKEPPVIQKLANGGIATRATNAIIGEAGREAVLPLENNTEWMDQLADRIAQRNRPAGTLVLKVGEREFGRVALDAINSNTRETGALGLVMV